MGAEPAAGTPPELWAGPEASYVRVGDSVTDQQALSGFSTRQGDLDRLASLGVRRVRFPLLWERERQDQDWAAYALPRLRHLGVNPVVGLVHHGGGAVPGGLLDPAFAEGLAEYAGRVARRFPWVDAYTPVNEPLTTARFSALYGLWHPHGRTDREFVRAVLAQVRGTVLAMRAVREINPRAMLIQTEDMGKVYGTPALKEQVDFENLRRWLSFDLLCGRVTEDHGLWTYLLWAGATPEDLQWFARHPCPPEVLGLNVYPTSERYLDEHLERYPARFHGGNGRLAYADVEAIRVRGDLPGLFFERLTEAHDRYHLPLALTEVHLGCTREEQLRWLDTAWQDACRASSAGAEVRAVTVWSVFGSFEWNSLMTRRGGHYEPGLWDVGGHQVRETALAALARDLGAAHFTGTSAHPVLEGPGWWKRPERRHWAGPDRETDTGQDHPAAGRPLLIGPGPLAASLEKLCLRRGLPTLRGHRTGGEAAEALPWASLEAGTTHTLCLHWLSGEVLSVEAAELTDLHLEAALDLLLDGESGFWYWDGHRFTPLPGPPEREVAGPLLDLVR